MSNQTTYVQRISRWTIFTSLMVGGCGDDGSYTTTDGDTGAPVQCRYKDPGTQFAPCEDDGDCFSGFCDRTGNPGPYCHLPTRIAREAGHGYDCSSDELCRSVVGSAAIASGITGECRHDSTYAGCLFNCTTPQ